MEVEEAVNRKEIDQLIETAQGVGASRGWGMYDKLVYLVELATKKEQASRQAAQLENEALKARIARQGVELRSAVNKLQKVPTINFGNMVKLDDVLEAIRIMEP